MLAKALASALPLPPDLARGIQHGLMGEPPQVSVFYFLSISPLVTKRTTRWRTSQSLLLFQGSKWVRVICGSQSVSVITLHLITNPAPDNQVHYLCPFTLSASVTYLDMHIRFHTPQKVNEMSQTGRS